MKKQTPKNEIPEWYKDAFGVTRDLNSEGTYESCVYKDYSARQLRDLIYQKVGYVTLYIKYFRSDTDFRGQEERIQNLLFWFNKEHSKYFQDTKKSRHWLRKFYYQLEDETENLC